MMPLMKTNNSERKWIGNVTVSADGSRMSCYYSGDGMGSSYDVAKWPGGFLGIIRKHFGTGGVLKRTGPRSFDALR